MCKIQTFNTQAEFVGMSLVVGRQLQQHPKWDKVTPQEADAYMKLISAIYDSFSVDMISVRNIFTSDGSSEASITKGKEIR